MIPCKYCGEWCGGTCSAAKSAMAKMWAKEVAFAQIYGGGMGGSPFKPKVDHANQTVDGKPMEQAKAAYDFTLDKSGAIYDSYGKQVAPPLVKVPDPLLPDGLKDFKGPKCPGCGNFTWKKGWHYETCEYHLPLGQCPVTSSTHEECKEAREALGQTLKGYTWHVTPTAITTFDTETTGMKGYTPIVEIMDEISDYASAKEKKPVKYDHSAYTGQLTSYAAHHGLSRMDTWEATLGKISAHHGYGWENPYKGHVIPSLKTADSPHWPNLLFIFDGGGCSCALCEDQKKMVLPPEAGKVSLKSVAKDFDFNPPSPWLTASSSEILKNITDAKAMYEQKPPLQQMPKAADPYNGYPAPTLKALAELLDAYLDTTYGTKDFAQKMSQGDMFLLTGKKYPEYSQAQLVHEAKTILLEYMEVDVDNDEEWIKALFEKNHGVNKASKPNVIVAKDVTITKLDKSGKPTGEPVPMNLKTGQITFLDGNFSVVEQKVVNYLDHEKAASQMAAYYGASVVNHSEFNQNITSKPAGKTEELKPGDQVIVQVSEAGTLFVPEGMTAIVMRK